MANEIENKPNDLYARVRHEITRRINNDTEKVAQSAQKPHILDRWYWKYLVLPILGAFIIEITYMQINPHGLLASTISIEAFIILFHVFLAAQKALFIKQQFLKYFIASAISTVIFISPYSVSLKLIELQLIFPASPHLFLMIINGFSLFLICSSMSMVASIIPDTAIKFKIIFGGFAPTMSLTVGNSSRDVTNVTEFVVRKETSNGTNTSALDYLKEVSQAMIDSAGTRAMPWVIFIAILPLGFGGFIIDAIKAPIALLGPFADYFIRIGQNVLQISAISLIFWASTNMAHNTSLDVLILHAISRIKNLSTK